MIVDILSEYYLSLKSSEDKSQKKKAFLASLQLYVQLLNS
jgi:hypothetical protein